MSPGEFAIVPTELIARLDCADLKIAAALQTFAFRDKQGWVSAFPKAIAEVAGVDKSTVTRRLVAMYDDGNGCLERRERPGARPGRKSYEYRLKLRRDDEPKVQGSAPSKVQPCTFKGAPGALPEEETLSRDSHPQASPSDVSHTRAKKPPPPLRAIDEDELLTTARLEIAIDEGLSEVEAYGAWEEFCVYWQDRRAKKSARGWDMTWRNRCKTLFGRRPPKSPPQRGSTPTLLTISNNGEVLHEQSSGHYPGDYPARNGSSGGVRAEAMRRALEAGPPERVRRRYAELAAGRVPST